MQASKSKDLMLKLVEPKLFGWFALVVCLIATVLFLSIGFGDSYFSRRLCIEEGCWEEFVRLFSLQVAMLVNGTKLLVAYSAIAGILVAVNTYAETRRMANSQVHLTSRATFESFVREGLAKMSHLTREQISLDTWYAVMFPGSRRGDLSLNDDYLLHLEGIKKFVEKTDALILRIGRGFRHDKYRGTVITMLSQLGFRLAGYSRLDFFSLEREAYQLINEVNIAFCVEDGCAKLEPSKAHGIP